MSMMNLKLETRVSTNSAFLTVPFDNIERLVRLGDKDQLFELFDGFIDRKENLIYDLVLLTRIVNWIPDPTKPPPLTELMKWASLAEKVGKLKNNAKTVDLSDHEQSIIWERLNDSKFSYVGSLTDYLPFHMRLFNQLKTRMEKG